MENTTKTDSPVDSTMLNPSQEIQVSNGGAKVAEEEHTNRNVNIQSKTVDKKTTKKSKEEKRLKEEEKRIKLLLRSYESVEDADSKINALAKKCVQLMADNKSLEYKNDDLESKNEKLIKERDNLQSDYNKTTLAKSKLESLCRELQRHSKLVKEECQLRTQEEEAKRKELSDRFQTTINDISQQMQDNFKRNEQLKVENEELATKLKGLVSQYETREEHVDKVVQHKQLELQLAEAKFAQQSLQLSEIKEKSLMEKQELIKDSLDYRKRYEIMLKQEAELKSQIALYTERFDEFQSTLNKSNEVFATFKTEMDKMSKTIKKLEKENKMLKSRGENTNRSLVAMLEERSNMEKQIKALTNKSTKLENLCRAMQQKNMGMTNKDSNTTKNEIRSVPGNGPQEELRNSEEEPNNDRESTVSGDTSNDINGEPNNDLKNDDKDMANGVGEHKTLSGDPDNLSGDPDNLSGDPDNLSGDPDNLSGDPDNLRGDPDNLSGDPCNQTGETISDASNILENEVCGNNSAKKDDGDSVQEGETKNVENTSDQVQDNTVESTESSSTVP